MIRTTRAPAWLWGCGLAMTLPWLFASGCSANKPPAKGQLMVAFQTDMSIPKDVTAIRIQVTQLGVTRHDNTYTLGPDQARLPATLAIVAGERTSDPVAIKLTAYRGNEAHVVKKITTTVPGDRIATLHMPIEWLCWDQLTVDGEDANGTCGEDATCVAGSCTSSHVDSSTLQTYDGKNVFGGAPGPGGLGTCLDVLYCFSQGYQTPVDTSDCSIALPPGADAASTNVGLVLPAGDQGICSNSTCMVALTSNATSGWSEQGGRAKLPKAVCDKLGSDVLGVAVTTACPTKTDGIPTCGPWSSVTSLPGNFDAGAPDASALGTDAGTDATAEDASDGGTVVLPAPELGKACTSDADCGSLKCIKATDTSLDGMGVEGGLCTAPCDSDPTVCGKMKAGAICHDFNTATTGGAFCTEGCSDIDAGPPCSGRSDVACTKLEDIATSSGTFACQPLCSSHSACSPGSCDFSNGLCSPGAPTGDPGTMGTECGDGGTSATCEGACLPFVNPTNQETHVSCSGLCSYGSVGCNWDGTGAPTSACVWPTDPNNAVWGATGQCLQLCDCSTQCANPAFQCTQFPPDLTGVFPGGWVGYCSPPFNPDGTALAGPPC